MLRDEPKTDKQETLWELKDILRDIDRCLDDSNIFNDTEYGTLYQARDGIVSVIGSLGTRNV